MLRNGMLETGLSVFSSLMSFEGIFKTFGTYTALREAFKIGPAMLVTPLWLLQSTRKARQSKLIVDLTSPRILSTGCTLRNISHKTGPDRLSCTSTFCKSNPEQVSTDVINIAMAGSTSVCMI